MMQIVYRVSLLCLWCLACAFLAAPARAQPVSSSGLAAVRIVVPLSVEMEVGLDFGALAGSATPGAVVVPALGAASATGGARLLGRRDARHAARFAVQGEPGRDYQITLPSSALVSDTTSSGPPRPALTASNFQAFSSNQGRTDGTGQLDQLGEDGILLGGQLDVPAHTRPGQYTLQVQFTIEYL
jgi:hypothetical protein